MSGENLDLKQGMTLKSATSDLVLSSRENMLLDQTTLDVGNEVAVRGLGCGDQECNNGGKIKT